MDKKRVAPKDVIIKLSKVKDRTLKQQEKSDFSHEKKTLIRLLVDFLAEILQANRVNIYIQNIKRKKKTVNQKYYYTWQICPSEMKVRQRLQKTRDRRIHHHQNYLTRNTKGHHSNSNKKILINIGKTNMCKSPGKINMQSKSESLIL